jgi:hypothetical protein
LRISIITPKRRNLKQESGVPQREIRNMGYWLKNPEDFKNPKVKCIDNIT